LALLVRYRPVVAAHCPSCFTRLVFGRRLNRALQCV
jgi:hypothetical protein